MAHDQEYRCLAEMHPRSLLRQLEAQMKILHLLTKACGDQQQLPNPFVAKGRSRTLVVSEVTIT
eukprot:3281162-Amphidinium_carterae.1